MATNTQVKSGCHLTGVQAGSAQYDVSSHLRCLISLQLRSTVRRKSSNLRFSYITYELRRHRSSQPSHSSSSARFVESNAHTRTLRHTTAFCETKAFLLGKRWQPRIPCLERKSSSLHPIEQATRKTRTAKTWLTISGKTYHGCGVVSSPTKGEGVCSPGCVLATRQQRLFPNPGNAACKHASQKYIPPQRRKQSGYSYSYHSLQRS